MENTNARYLKPEDLGDRFDLITMDVSFISVNKILAALVPLLREGGRIIVLVKPQFEVGKGEVGKGGIVKDETKRDRVVEEVKEFAERIGLQETGVIKSPITGAEGNVEFLMKLSRSEDE
jgi:23S rRNA (cytidine1920-2'-O)/16S rRNA (cytidine1409-2'-O)-methyltransferase